MSEEIELHVLAESFAEMLGSEWPREKALAHARGAQGLESAFWDQVVALGWTALTVPENHGGLGMGSEALAALHGALGSAAAPSPLLGTALAAELLARAGSDAQQSEWLARLADGSCRVAFAPIEVPAILVDGEMVSGVAEDLVDAATANTFFLRAERGGARGWLIVEQRDAGVAVVPIPIADTTRTMAKVTLADTPLRSDRFVASSPQLDDAILRCACIAIAADALGGGEAALSGTIEYMKIREQFGRRIGSFQALKHRVADHQAALVGARALIDLAVAASADDEALIAAVSAKQHVTRVVAEIARDCVQLHGGVGFTAEYFPHVYLKRAKLNEALFGTRVQLLDRLADLLVAA